MHLKTALERLGVTVSTSPPTVVREGKNLQIKNTVTVLRNGVEVTTVTITCGIGHLKVPTMLNEVERRVATWVPLKAFHDDQLRLAQRAATEQSFAPSCETVMECLLADISSPLDNFDDWCAEYGYSNDSIKARKAFHDCVATNAVLRIAFTDEEIQQLHEHNNG